jgi:predicted nucleic acid-binding protein
MSKMPRAKDIVINTSPIIAIVAALGDLHILQIYRRVWVPFEVGQEISAGGAARFAVAEFEAAHWLQKRTSPLHIAPVLLNTLDTGEAAVIQLALDESVQTVCIDEAAGRRIARLNDLSVTGSIGILLRALNEGHRFSMREAIDRMMAQGIWLSDRVIEFALTRAGEGPDVIARSSQS